MEIERKFLIKEIPFNLDEYPHRTLVQGYLCVDPVVRIRQNGTRYELTYKSKGFMEREEYNLPLTQEAFEHLSEKIDGRIIKKERYCIPYKDKYTIELDIFMGYHAPLILAEVEFDTKEEAVSFLPPDWFGKDVTACPDYHNSVLSQK